MLAAGLGFALARAACAQSVWPTDNDPSAAAAPDAAAPAASAPDTGDDSDVLKDVDQSKLDFTQLNVDASTLTSSPSVKKQRPAQAPAGDSLIWSQSDRRDGSSAVSVKQSLFPFWDTRVGADMTVAREPTTMSELLAEKSANNGADPQSGGSAWASITAPGAGSIWDKTAVEARFDPGQDQSRLGTTLSKALPLSDRYALTLQDRYSLIQQGVVPVPGIIARPEAGYETGQSARLSIADTATSFMVGQTLSSSEDRWLRQIGAEQKLFGDVSVAASVGETAQGTLDSSITAGYQRSW